AVSAAWADVRTGRAHTRQSEMPSLLDASPITLMPHRRWDRNSITVSDPTTATPALWTVITRRCGSVQTVFTCCAVRIGLFGYRTTGSLSETILVDPSPQSTLRST